MTGRRWQFELILIQSAVAIDVELPQRFDRVVQLFGADGTIAVHVQGFRQAIGSRWRRRKRRLMVTVRTTEGGSSRWYQRADRV
jgi:hypothetical protein